MKKKFSLLFLILLICCNVFSQDKALWKINVIDSLVSLNLPGDLKTETFQERLIIGNMKYEQFTFVFMKIDVIDTVPMAKDTAMLRENYKKMAKGFLNRSKGELVKMEEVKQGDFIGNYIKTRVSINGENYIIELKAFFLNGDGYNLQIIYPAFLENTLIDIRKSFLDSFMISPNAKQIQLSN